LPTLLTPRNELADASLAEMVATLQPRLCRPPRGGQPLGPRTASTAASMPRLRQRLCSGGDFCQTLAHQGLREHGRGRRTVAGTSLGLVATFRGSCGAHVLVGNRELDLFGDSSHPW